MSSLTTEQVIFMCQNNKLCWFSVQLKPIGSFCNLNCSYCYAKSSLAKRELMSSDILEIVIRKIMEQNHNPTFSWHGGEPTLVGLEFFNQAISLMKKYKKPNQNFYNLIQTNGTLITPALARFFKEHNFGVSVSIDGKKNIHGKNRKNKAGKNSFDAVMQGVKNLRNVGINPSIICTVSKENLSFATENLEFFINNGFNRIKYSPVFDSMSDSFSITSEEWFLYLKNIFDIWFSLRDPNLKIRDIDELIAWLYREPLNLCSSNRTCLNWISIDPKGDIYPCEYLKGDYYYGNILNTNIQDIHKNKNYQNFKKIFNNIPQKCKICEFFDVCGNGCPTTRIINNKVSLNGVYAFCKQRRKLFYVIKKEFNNALT